MDASAKRLAKVDDEWSKAAATKDADRVVSFYADASFSISWKTVHAEVSKSGDLGYTAGTYQA
jgi:hypothetical protein